MRNYLPADFELNEWNSLLPYFQELKDREIESATDLEKWMKDRSELESYISENIAWRYIKMTCDTTNEAFSEAYQFFIKEISPKIAPFENELNLKLYQSLFLRALNAEKYKIYIRGLKNDIELYREENIELFTDLQLEAQKYSSINGAMSITHNGKELTMQQAAVLLKNADRKLREEVYVKISERRLKDRDQLEAIFDIMVRKRHQAALNAGFNNFRDYKHAALGRFDYTPKDCFSFHEAIKKNVVPVTDHFHLERKKALKLETLKPWDLAVETEGKQPLKPFEGGDDLLNKTISCFTRLDPYFGNCLKTMKEIGNLDLVSRKGKAPGGYNYPLMESGVPFIFMNATSTLRDMITMIHEGGHAVHSFLTKDKTFNFDKSTPSELAELASMSMELITMDYWDEFFKTEEELKRAKKEHLEDALSTFPWVATVDKFQHWCYENPNHTPSEREHSWNAIMTEFGSSVVDWAGQEQYKSYAWHKQLHIFEVPFYYIEYAMAQLGAIAMWKNYKENPKKGVEGYKAALSLGYTKTIGETYASGGIKFDFSSDYVKELVDFVKKEIDNLN